MMGKASRVTRQVAYAKTKSLFDQIAKETLDAYCLSQLQLPKKPIKFDPRFGVPFKFKKCQ